MKIKCPNCGNIAPISRQKLSVSEIVICSQCKFSTNRLKDFRIVLSLHNPEIEQNVVENEKFVKIWKKNFLGDFSLLKMESVRDHHDCMQYATYNYLHKNNDHIETDQFSREVSKVYNGLLINTPYQGWAGFTITWDKNNMDYPRWDFIFVGRWYGVSGIK